MIKKTGLMLLACTLTATGSYADELVAGDDSGFTQICMTAIAGNRAAMHNNMQISGYSRSYIVENVQCNGINILAFVENHGENPSAMLKMLDRRQHSTSITDLAKNTVPSQ